MSHDSNASNRLGGPGSVCILGGSFNPMHAAHVRVAVALREAAAMERVDIIPAPAPPHKPGRRLLPMELRMTMAEAVAARLNSGTAAVSPPVAPAFRVSDIEARRTGPSYTLDTLREYRRAEPETRLFFCLGATDMVVLDSWHEWRELPALATFIIVTRGETDVADVLAFMNAYPKVFPNVGSITRSLTTGFGGEFPNSGCEYEHIAWDGGWAAFMTMPRLDVSGTQIRALWRANRRLIGLLPDCVEDVLTAHEKDVEAVWGARGSEPT